MAARGGHLWRELRRLCCLDGRSEGARALPLCSWLRWCIRPADDAARGYANSAQPGQLAQGLRGEDTAALAAASPSRLAERIKTPVFLTDGGDDEIAPIEHTRMMEAALRKAGVPVESLCSSTEGHGFFTEPHQREY